MKQDLSALAYYRQPVNYPPNHPLNKHMDLLYLRFKYQYAPQTRAVFLPI